MLRRWLFNLVLLIAIFYILAEFSDSSIYKRAEGMFFDFRYQLSLDEEELNKDYSKNNQTLINNILIVDIDDHSLDTIGRWPWSRQKITQLLSGLHAQEAMIIAMDIVLSEPENNIIDYLIDSTESSLSSYVKQELSLHHDTYDYDKLLAKQLNKQDVVLGYFFNDQGTLHTPLPTSPIKGSSKNTSLISYNKYTVPIPALSKKAIGHGFLTILPDDDGVYRRAPMVISHKDRVYPSLSLETLRQYLFVDDIHLNFEQQKDKRYLKEINLGRVKIPTDADGRIIIPFKGKRKSFKYISAADIINGTKHPEIKNSIVLIGTSALGLADLRTVPVDTLFPGVEVHANIINAVINGQSLYYQPSWAWGASIVITLLLSLWILWILPKLGVASNLLVIVITMSALLISNYLIWKYQSIDIPISLSFFILLGLIVKEFVTSLFREQQQRKVIKNHFDKYVPAAHIEEMINKPESFTLTGQKKEMTVLFADIRNFTGISETLEVEDLKSLLNAYFTPITKIIFENNGTVDKFIGDMVMAFWNAPLDDSNHAHNAIVTAKTMLDCTQELNKTFIENGMPEINIGIGINTGVMNVGDMGSEMRRNYTVLGSAVNAGARIESLTKAYHVPLLVGQKTKAHCPQWIFRHIDCLAVKGQIQPINIYEPIALSSAISSDQLSLCEQHNKVMEVYLDGRLQECMQQMKILKTLYPDDAFYSMFIQKLKLRIDNIRKKLNS